VAACGRHSGDGRLSVLTWNLFHGRSLPPAGRALEKQFATALAGWEWDVALLQEVPPWWPPRLARATGAEQRTALTSRNAGLPFRRVLAERWPDLIRSNGGGCNAILARRPIAEHRAVRLRLWPERRVAQLARLQDGIWVVNFHGSARVGLARAELERLWELTSGRAGPAPVVLGGDLNLREPRVEDHLAVHAARRDVDHVFARGFERAAEARRLDRRAALSTGRRVELSDHVPLAVELALGRAWAHGEWAARG
jgi:endonuclease/exonuclease/phosphatase family metal-dependent hydrolase